MDKLKNPIATTTKGNYQTMDNFNLDYQRKSVTPKVTNRITQNSKAKTSPPNRKKVVKVRDMPLFGSLMTTMQQTEPTTVD